ncbi:MAG: hypothetical protein M1838_004337 [Thelocarpon superellum]|nr:MAG: hypothetical protein M1838_004337 [Thelocarpon superellum]
MIDLMRSLISADVGMATATSVLWMVRHLLAKSVTAKSHLQRDLVLYFAAAICSSRAFIFEALFDAFRGDEIISSASGVNPLDYPHAYFVTAPRFLGYSFNPVSFWHLYDKDREFRAIILEVNNTFDERRMYFLPKSATDAESGLADVPLKLKASWSKDFHVSPFNSRDGSYSLIASDPLLPKMAGPAKIRNSVTLRSAEGPVTLVANIYSTHPAIDPAAMTRFSTLTFVADWWWVGFATFPRIVREAAKLFIKRSRGIRLILRPEVKALSLAREETADERYDA